MRKLSLGWLVGTAVLVPLLLLGCASAPDPQWTDGPAPTETVPVFASNDEALAAATKAYGDYIAMSDLISNEGGVDAERIAPFVTAQLLVEELKQFVDFKSAEAHSTGLTVLRVVSMQSARYSSPGETEISLYVCEDLAGVDVLDNSGQSMVSPTRESVSGFVARLVAGSQSQLVVSGRDLWAGRAFC